MKILLAPNSFKGTLTAREVINILKKCAYRIIPNVEIIEQPLADGGDGTLNVFMETYHGVIKKALVHNPIGKVIEVEYGIINNGKTAVIEMAKVSGIILLKNEEKNPLLTSSYGTGELIKKIIDEGINNIIIGIGGSASHDGGVGLAQALGIRFFDKMGLEIGLGCSELKKITTIDTSNVSLNIKNCQITVLYDVINPLTGENSVSKVYGKQKGATPEMIIELEENLEHLREVIIKQYKIDPNHITGCGAAGGIGTSLFTFFKAKLVRGIDYIISMTNLENKIESCDLVITGEGKLDSQTSFGKALLGLAKLCKLKQKPTIVIAGSIEHNADKLFAYGITDMYSCICKPMTIDEALNNSISLLEEAANRVFRAIAIKSGEKYV
ncbi:MAG TPA: glycerate kinase [Haloplasmataceae bacterium]